MKFYFQISHEYELQTNEACYWYSDMKQLLLLFFKFQHWIKKNENWKLLDDVIISNIMLLLRRSTENCGKDLALPDPIRGQVSGNKNDKISLIERFK